MIDTFSLREKDITKCMETSLEAFPRAGNFSLGLPGSCPLIKYEENIQLNYLMKNLGSLILVIGSILMSAVGKGGCPAKLVFSGFQL